MFASLVNYYKVSEIEKSSSNNENIRQISSSDILSPKTVASLRRQPLQEISIDLLKKQQVINKAQNMNISKLEVQNLETENEKLIAQQEQYKANEIMNSLKKKISRSENELKLTKEKVTLLEQSCSKLQESVNHNMRIEVGNNNLQQVFCDEIVGNSSKIYTNIETECKSIRNQIDGMLSLTDEQSQIIFQAKKSFEEIIENLQSDFTKEVSLVEENCKMYGMELAIANEKIAESNLQKNELIDQLNNSLSQSNIDKKKIKILEQTLQEFCKYKRRKIRKVYTMKRLGTQKRQQSNNTKSKSNQFIRNLNDQLSNIQQYLSLIDSENQRINQENIKLRDQLYSKNELLEVSDTTSKTLIATIEANKQEDQRLLERINSLEEELKALVKISPKHETPKNINHSELGPSGYDETKGDIMMDNSRERLHHIKSLFFCLVNAKSSHIASSRADSLCNLFEFNSNEKKIIKDAILNMYSPYSVFSTLSEDVNNIFSSVTKAAER